MMNLLPLLLVLLATTGCQVSRVTPARPDSARAQATRSAATTRGFLLGLRTVKLTATNLDSAKAWYREVLGKDPYFDEPYYVGFNVAGFELGIVPDAEAGRPGDRKGDVAYWGVTDASVAWARLMDLGATSHEPIEDVGGGIRIGSVRDPFGNILGIVENPGFRIEE